MIKVLLALFLAAFSFNVASAGSTRQVDVLHLLDAAKSHAREATIKLAQVGQIATVPNKQIAPSAGTPVAFNRQASGVTIINPGPCAPCTNTTMTISGSANPALIVLVMVDVNNPEPTSVAVAWDNTGTPQTMTALGSCAISGGVSGVAYIFGLRGPHTGNLTMAISWSGGSGGAYVDAVQFDNVNQGSDAAAFPSAGQVCNTGSSTSPSVTIPTASTHAVVSLINIGSGGGLLSSPSDTLIFNSNLGNINNAGAQYRAPSSTTSAVMNATIASVPWSVAGVDIAP